MSDSGPQEKKFKGDAIFIAIVFIVSTILAAVVIVGK